MKFWTFTLLSVLDAGCGRDVSGLPVTVCGMYLDIGQVREPALPSPLYILDVAGARNVERIVVEEFQKSVDPRLHDVCNTVQGYVVELRDVVVDPWEPSKEVGGFCDCGHNRLIRVDNFLHLPNEMAHAAQGCNWRLGTAFVD